MIKVLKKYVKENDIDNLNFPLKLAGKQIVFLILTL